MFPMSRRPLAGRRGVCIVNELKEKRQSVENEYARLASVYDRKWRHYVEATSRETMARIPVSGADRVLDVGCGTGVLLEWFGRSGAGMFLVGLDPVPGMLAVARSRLRGVASLATGRAESLPFRDEAFDTVISCSVLHYVDTPRRSLREAARVLVSGGCLVLTDWCADFLPIRLLGLFLRMRGRPLRHVYRAGELVRLLEAAGFQSVAIERYRVGRCWGLMTATARKPRGSPDTGHARSGYPGVTRGSIAQADHTDQ